MQVGESRSICATDVSLEMVTINVNTLVPPYLSILECGPLVFPGCDHHCPGDWSLLRLLGLQAQNHLFASICERNILISIYKLSLQFRSAFYCRALTNKRRFPAHVQDQENYQQNGQIFQENEPKHFSLHHNNN